MTTFWSLYVTVLTLGTIFALTWLAIGELGLLVVIQVRIPR